MQKIQESSTIGRRLVRILIWILIVFLVFEITTRVWLDFFASNDLRLEYLLYPDLGPQDWRYIPHQYLNYYPNPRFKKGKTYHNSLGYRNKEFPVKKPDGVFRIAVLGGSTTYTIAVDDNEKTFPAQLEHILRDKYGYKNVEVINAGVGGYNSWETLINFEFRVLDLDPDLVIEYEGANDVHARFVDPASYRGDDSGRRKQWEPPPIPLFEHSAFLRVLSRRLGITSQPGILKFITPETAYKHGSLVKHDPMKLLNENPPIYFRRNLNNLIAIAKANNVDIMFATWAYSTEESDYGATPYYRRGFEENNAVVKEVAEKNGIPLLNLEKLMPGDSKYWADSRHVNELGAEKKAEIFAQFIYERRLIKQ